MILNTHRNTSPRLAKTWLAFITSAAALLAVASLCSAPRIVLAQNETPAAADPTPPADAPTVGVASVAFAPEAPDYDSADELPRTTPPPPGAGPKFKPGKTSILNLPPPVKVAPAAPPAPVTATVPPTPALAAATTAPEPQVPRPPRPARTPRPGNADSSLEERLERLERMVESLMKQPNFHLKNEGMLDRKESAKVEALARRQVEEAWKPMISPKEVEKIKQQAQREAARAVDQAQRDAARAVDQAKRATAEIEKSVKAEQKRQNNWKIKEGSQKQLEALRKQLEMLEREREKLDRQIEELERDREQLDEQRDEDQTGGDPQPEESKAECVAQRSSGC